ncbi:hypothetical protein TNCV_2159411 [Trichonephila clavipes]|nr:hypothetical protein TNCV_2159411 [Trichonephila clavipes]
MEHHMPQFRSEKMFRVRWTESESPLPWSLIALDHTLGLLLVDRRVVVLGFWTVRTVLNPISGQDFDAGHADSGVLQSARWHDGDWLRWRGYVLRLDGEFSKFFDLADSLVTAL